MKYPTLDEVEKAGHEQICRWWRFLKSPGQSAIGKGNFTEIGEQELKVMNRIAERLKKFGGFTPAISKRIGWER